MKYTIHKDFYYTSNGYDCCEPDRWEFYYISDEYGNKAHDFYIKHGVKVIDAAYESKEEEGEVYGDTERTFSSIQEALEFLLEQQGIEIEQEEEEDYDY